MKTPWIFLLAFTLMFYANGAMFIEGFVNYPSWRLIGGPEFIAYHHFITPRVQLFLVLPAVLGLILNLLLLWFRPRAVIPLWTIWTTLILQAIHWASTALIQIPMQMQLGHEGKSQTLIDHLIVTNFWFRRVPYGLCALLFLWMAARLMKVNTGLIIPADETL